MKKKVVVLGSTGSIGTQTLDVISAFPERFAVLALCAFGNAALLNRQIEAFSPAYAGLCGGDASALTAKKGMERICGAAASRTLAALDEADIVVIGISGFAGLPALLSALRAGKTVALANKESIVCGNKLVKDALKRYGGSIVPVDSEHSALFQCMQNGGADEIACLHLTASGGPFWQKSDSELREVTPEQALRHPVWNMGRKLTIDSATLFNKGLEVIEASFLFDLPNSQIDVLIHPQSIVHSMVEYRDGAVIAQLSSPDMRLAIQYALTYPERGERVINRLSLAQIGELSFFGAGEFPAIRLAYAALDGGEHLPIVYNAANEAAVSLFFERAIGFLDIRKKVEDAMEHVAPRRIDSLDDVMLVDEEARRFVRNAVI